MATFTWWNKEEQPSQAPIDDGTIALVSRTLAQHHIDAYLWTLEDWAIWILRKDGSIYGVTADFIKQPHTMAETLPKRSHRDRWVDVTPIPYVDPTQFKRIVSWWKFLRYLVTTYSHTHMP